MNIEKIAYGKVRDIYDLEDYLLLVTTDRISAFDVILPNTIPIKGAVLNQLSAFWLKKIEKELEIPTHFVSIKNADMPAEFQTPEFEDRCMLVKKLKMLPIEAIVRGYLVGSGWASYKKTGKVCGITLPEGLQEAEKLPTPIYTPTTKATEGHDEHITFEQSVQLLGEDIAVQVRDLTIKIYSAMADFALTRGIIIADTKFEFGIDETGRVVLADEVLTPDSSRFWPADDYVVGKTPKSFDKQYVRDYLKSIGFDGNQQLPVLPEDVIKVTKDKYLEAYLRLTRVDDKASEEEKTYIRETLRKIEQGEIKIVDNT